MMYYWQYFTCILTSKKYLKLPLAARAVHLDTLLSARGYLTDFSNRS